MRAEVVVVSTTRARGERTDTTGPVIADRLRSWGFTVAEPIHVGDDAVAEALAAAVTRRPQLIVTTGGTGLTGDDRTPDATAALVDRDIPGLAEAIRARGARSTPMAALSRGVVGVAGRTLLVNLPGSSGGVRDGLDVVGEVIEHLVAQLHDGDRDAHPSAHSPRPDAPATAPVEVAIARIRADPIDLATHIDAVSADENGAVASFLGVVRDHDGGRAVTALHYEAHPDAEAVLREAAAQIVRTHRVSVAVSHRVGSLAIGDIALVATVSAPHRGPAFAAVAALVDTVKATVPIWKRQEFADGAAQWVGLDDEPQAPSAQ